MGRDTFRRRLPLLLLLAIAGCGGGSKAPQATSTDANGCTTVEQPKPANRSEPKPTKRLDPAKHYDVTFRTNCGSFTVRLAVKTSPATAASFASLVQKAYFDHTIFHRIVPDFIVQGGDPTASGQGGPGYTTVDAPPATTKYTLGLVAMAKTATEAPGTSGSQFFIVTAQDAPLPPDYAVLGSVVRGLQVVNTIGQLGDATTEQPTQVVEIQKATLHVS